MPPPIPPENREICWSGDFALPGFIFVLEDIFFYFSLPFFLSYLLLSLNPDLVVFSSRWLAEWGGWALKQGWRHQGKRHMSGSASRKCWSNLFGLFAKKYFSSTSSEQVSYLPLHPGLQLSVSQVITFPHANKTSQELRMLSRSLSDQRWANNSVFE